MMIDEVNTAIDLIKEMDIFYTATIQRKMKIGYPRAARIIDEMIEMGVVKRAEGAGYKFIQWKGDE